MIGDNNREMIRTFIKREIMKLGGEQVNLSSAAAAEHIASRLASSLMGSFYVIPYSSQESFE